MKTVLRFVPLLLASLAAPVLAQPPLPLPQGSFACHVLTRDGQDGLVFVQADSVARARIVAAQSDAFIADGRRSPAARTVECESRFEADFASDAANLLLERLVL